MRKGAKMNYKKYFLMILLSPVLNNLRAQNSELSLDSVLQIGFQNNFNLKISRNVNFQAKNLATLGQAGYFPTIGVNGNGSFSSNNTKLEFAGGLPTVERNGAVNTGYGANLGLNYIVFNGFGRVAGYRQLMSQERLTDVQAKVVAENLTMDIVSRFLNIQQLILELSANKDNLSISEVRFFRTNWAYQNGSKSKIDLLSAQMDLVSDSLNVLNVQTNLQKELNGLKVLIGQSPQSQLDISKETPVPVISSYTEIIERARINNTGLLLANISSQMALNNVMLAKSKQLPQMSVSANYGYQSSQNGAGIILAQNTLGLNTSASLTMPIFNGNQLVTAIKNAKIESENADLKRKQTELEIEQLILNAELDEILLKRSLESLNARFELAKVALERGEFAYNSGQITYNDLRILQLNLLNIQNAINLNRINLIKLRYSVLRLSGDLFK